MRVGHALRIAVKKKVEAIERKKFQIARPILTDGIKRDLKLLLNK